MSLSSSVIYEQIVSDLFMILITRSNLTFEPVLERKILCFYWHFISLQETALQYIVLHIIKVMLSVPPSHEEQEVNPLPQPQTNQATQKRPNLSSNYKFAKLSIILGGIILLLLYVRVAYLKSQLSTLQEKQSRINTLASQLQAASAQLSKKVQSESIVLRYQNRTQKFMKSKVQSDLVYTNLKEKHYLQKIAFIKQMAQTDVFKYNPEAKVSYLLGMNNYKMVHQNIHIKREIEKLLQNQYQRLSKEHDFSLPEQPFCIVVPTLNNGQDFRYQYNLQSIYNQNYTNYKVVVIDDASRDSTFELTQAFIQDNPIPQPVYLIRNKERISALPNIYKAATEYCAPEDILALVDGDDELLGVNVLKVLNSMYTKQGLQVLYSNFINSNRRGHKVRLGWSSGYDPQEKKFSIYRQQSTRMFPLRSFRVRTFLKIPVANLQDDEGNFFKSAYDQTICPQVLELSCGRNAYLKEYHYFRNAGLGNNDMEVDPQLNFRIIYTVRNKRKRLGLDCDL